MKKPKAKSKVKVTPRKKTVTKVKATKAAKVAAAKPAKKKSRAKPVAMEHPKGFAARPANTRWPAEITIGSRHRKEFGDLGELAASIDERGALLQAIAITADGELIAGERRLKAWSKSKFKDEPIPVHVITVDSILAGEWDENAQRKDFTPSEAVSIKKAMEKLLGKMAQERMLAGKKADGATGNAGDQAAKFTGRTRRTLDKAEQVVEAAEREPEKFGKLQADMDRTGKVDGPFKRLMIMQQTEALKKSPPALPMRGPYNVLAIDHSWPSERDADQESIDARGRSMRPYPEMSVETGKKFYRSKEFQSLIANDATIYFWTTNHHMPDAFVLLDAMGFPKHSTIGTWGKNKMGNGQVLRGKTEHCIIATRGKPLVNLTNETTLWEGEGWEVRENSRKPVAFYELVERLTPATRYAEIFSRGGLNEKWDCHGDQAGKFAPSVAKEAMEAVLAEVQKTPDEIKLMVLEAVEGGETPDMRLVDKKLIGELERLVTGKKKLKLTPSGQMVLRELREAAADEKMFAELPEDIDELTTLYRAAITELDAAVHAGDDRAIDRADRRLEMLQERANGGTHFGMACDTSPAESLRRACAAELGKIPLWGQRGIFECEVDGVRCIVESDSTDLSLYAVERDKGFISETGYRGVLGHLGDHHTASVASFAELCIREVIENETDPKNGRLKKRKKPLPLPERVYTMPKTWDGRERAVEALAEAEAEQRLETEAAIVRDEPAPSAKPKRVKRTLPGRDQELVDFATREGHTVTMTLDGDDNVGTCKCGAVFRFPRSDRHKQMDAAITAHWLDVKKACELEGEMEIAAEERLHGGGPVQVDLEEAIAAAAAPVEDPAPEPQPAPVNENFPELPGFLDVRQRKEGAA